jgi:tripartite-type tricarboxylate transporter receptor subunit TctC
MGQGEFPSSSECDNVNQEEIMSRNSTAAIGGVVLLVMAALPVFAAENWPSKSIRLIVPFPAGGSTDITARVLAEGLRPLLGQPFVIDNRAGAGGNIAAEVAAKSTPDGYTFLVSGATLATNVSLYKNLRYDFVQDFAHVSQVFSSANVLVVSPSLPVANLADFITLVKSGQKVNYGSGGHGTSQHLAAALFNNMVGGSMTHVPYKGGAPATIALLGGEVQLIFAPVIEVIAHIKSGAVKPLGASGSKRSAMVPDVPLIGDLVPGYVSTSWGGIAAPARTPSDIVNRMSEAIVKVLTQPSVRASLAEGDKEPVGSSPTEFKKFIAVEVERLRMQVKVSGARID